MHHEVTPASVPGVDEMETLLCDMDEMKIDDTVEQPPKDDPVQNHRRQGDKDRFNRFLFGGVNSSFFGVDWCKPFICIWFLNIFKTLIYTYIYMCGIYFIQYHDIILIYLCFIIIYFMHVFYRYNTVASFQKSQDTCFKLYTSSSRGVPTMLNIWEAFL